MKASQTRPVAVDPGVGDEGQPGRRTPYSRCCHLYSWWEENYHGSLQWIHIMDSKSIIYMESADKSRSQATRGKTAAWKLGGKQRKDRKILLLALARERTLADNLEERSCDLATTAKPEHGIFDDMQTLCFFTLLLLWKCETCRFWVMWQLT